MHTLSICIPVYNTSIKPLVTALLAREADYVKEILIFDDGSSEAIKHENKELSNVLKVLYKEMPENVGRSKIRNNLGKAATGDFLLFIDDDCVPEKSNFLEHYYHHFKEASVFCGGHIYPEKVAPSQTLHHFIGKQSEVKSAEDRNQKPFNSFHSSNFCIKREVFLAHPFNEQLTQYGHEDTLFGFELKKAGNSLLHLTNPVVHLGVQTNAVFLEKTEKALQNLAYLYKSADKDFVESVKVLRLYATLKQFGVAGIIAVFFQHYGKTLKHKLQNETPSLRRYNIFKLAYLCWLLK